MKKRLIPLEKIVLFDLDYIRVTYVAFFGPI